MNCKETYSIFPLGDSALLVNFGNVIDEAVNDKVLLAFYLIKSRSLPGITDVVPSYGSLSIHYDIVTVQTWPGGGKSSYDKVATIVHDVLNEEYELLPYTPRLLKIPVCYAPAMGPDIGCLARYRHLSVDEVVRIHSSRRYRVYMIGFMPGFTYMAEVDERIQVRRRVDPRTRVEAGSVGIAGKQTGIYPVASPGGWQIIGRTPVTIFNQDFTQPVLFQPGDEVEFYSITEDEFNDFNPGHNGYHTGHGENGKPAPGH